MLTATGQVVIIITQFLWPHPQTRSGENVAAVLPAVLLVLYCASDGGLLMPSFMFILGSGTIVCGSADAIVNIIPRYHLFTFSLVMLQYRLITSKVFEATVLNRLFYYVQILVSMAVVLI